MAEDDATERGRANAGGQQPGPRNEVAARHPIRPPDDEARQRLAAGESARALADLQCHTRRSGLPLRVTCGSPATGTKNGSNDYQQPGPKWRELRDERTDATYVIVGPVCQAARSQGDSSEESRWKIEPDDRSSEETEDVRQGRRPRVGLMLSIATLAGIAGWGCCVFSGVVLIE